MAIAYFEFMGTDPDDRFVIQLVEQEKIDHARAVLAGVVKDRVHVQGTVVTEPTWYNPGWRYHLLPESIEFFELAIEVCDAAMCYIEEHLSDVGGAFLPGRHWCPWTSMLTRELDPAESRQS